MRNALGFGASLLGELAADQLHNVCQLVDHFLLYLLHACAGFEKRFQGSRFRDEG
jgi:hypothetical protein